MNKDKDRSRYKYVLYARKSSEEAGAQANSIKDQIKKCKEFAERLGDINIVDIKTEEKSAKYANNREVFAEVIEKVRSGEYDGIIAYHPDRLARNMLEAGIVLDMLTPAKNEKERLLKSLLFPTVEYANDSGGRLMLAMLFSMATQFSEHLSEVVKRGVSGNLERGISSGTPKWGYDRSEITGHYEPNEYYDDIKKGWEMLKNGKSQAEIVEFWDKQGVHRLTKISRKNKQVRRITISEKMTPTIFRDPFYCGILRQSNQEINLTELYPDFKPMVSEKEYHEVQALLRSGNQNHRQKYGGKFIPLKGMVFCDVCGSKMYGGASKNRQGKRYVYYNCQNKECVRSAKSVRGEVVFNHLYDCLEHVSMGDKEYKEYCAAVDSHIEKYTDALKTKRRSLVGKKNQTKALLDDENRRYSFIADPVAHTPEGALESARNRIKVLDDKIIDLNNEIADIDKKLAQPERVKLARDEFLNLLKTAAQRMKCGNFVEKDAVARTFFLNLKITDKNSLIYLCKPEFDGLLKSGVFQTGARDWT